MENKNGNGNGTLPDYSGVSQMQTKSDVLHRISFRLKMKECKIHFKDIFWLFFLHFGEPFCIFDAIYGLIHELYFAQPSNWVKKVKLAISEL